MCGIAGWYSWGQRRPSPELVKGLLVANETRGQDAAGVAFQDPDSKRVYIRKAKGPARIFVKSQPTDFWQQVAASPIGLLHARAATKGHESVNDNNHPVHGLGWVVVHNGHVHNDDDLWTHYGGKRIAEVDTSAIPLVLSQGSDYMDSLQHMTLLAGGATCGIWSVKEPEKLALVRLGGNSLHMFLDGDILYWSSAAIAGRIMPGPNVGALPFVSMTQLPEDRCLILTPGESRGEMFKVTRNPFFARGVASRHHSHRPSSQSTTASGTSGTNHNTSSANAGRTKPIATVTPTGEIIVGPGTDKAGERLPRIKWVPHNTAQFPRKPIPQLPKSTKFSWDHFDFNRALEETRKTTAEKGVLRLQTLFGHWVFINPRDPSGKTPIYRHFKAYKSHKKFLRRAFDANIAMPVQVTDGKTSKFDGKMWLDDFDCWVPVNGDQTKSDWQGGYACPWCGIVAQNRQWYNWDYRCPFCRIRTTSAVVPGGNTM